MEQIQEHFFISRHVKIYYSVNIQQCQSFRFQATSERPLMTVNNLADLGGGGKENAIVSLNI